MVHWGGPVRYIDTRNATPYIVLKKSEKSAILDEINKKLSEEELSQLFEYLKLREIVDIVFE